MNAKRKKQIEKIVFNLTELQGNLNAICEEEQEYLDNMPENMKCSEKASESDNFIQNMWNADTFIEDALNELQNITGE